MGGAAFIDRGPSTPRPANGGASTARRLEALHRKSGEITHDLNNLLGVILSASERLAEELAEGGEQQALALLALEAAERAAELLRRKLAIAQGRSAGPHADTADGAEALAALERMAGQAVGPGVRLRVFGSALPLLCVGDRTGLEMALLNLVLNADQAMPDGGRVFVQARRSDVSGSDGARLGLAPGLFIAFTVRDTGPGMSPEVLARAADPLFTTKANGAGLGLSSIADFAASCGGVFALQSREGLGTAATLYLPAAAGGCAAAAAAA